ncbi:cytosine permease [Desulfovibrio aminophilus]|uniref:cytosine permease n=1 Tax=Desulfovibrio aminophilus TaxID=81425 RepID=UPI003395BBD4
MSQPLEYAANDSISNAHAENPELLPSLAKDRTLSMWDIIVLCAGMVVNVVGLVIPGQVLLRGAYSPLEILIACFWGFSLVTVLIVLTGDIGTKYGLPFTVIIRDCFGKKGALVGSLCRAVVCMTWTGVLLFFGTEAINTVLQTMTGISAFWVVFAIFAALQLINASRNVKSMSRFGWVAIPILAVALVFLVAWLLQEYAVSLPTVLAASPLPGEGFPFITVVAIFSGGWLSEALNGSDLSRKIRLPEHPERMPFLKRNARLMAGFAIGFIGTGVMLSLAGLVCAYLTNSADPVGVVKAAFASKPAALIFSCVVIVMAQWSTNTAANIFPATLIFLNAFPRLSFARATWLVGLVSCCMMPWLLASYLDYVQMVFSALLAPLLGIMLVHYYVIRKGELDVDSLYDADMPDWKAPGLLSLVAGLIAGAVFHDWAFFAAFPVAAICHLLLMRRTQQAR